MKGSEEPEKAAKGNVKKYGELIKKGGPGLYTSLKKILSSFR